MNRSRDGAGFTLVEMLVVIGVMGILAALLVPVLGYARSVAQETRCIGNLKAIGTGVVLYVQAYDNYLPACGSNPDELATYKVWYRALLPYTENWLVYACPSKYVSALDIPDIDDKTKQPPNMLWHEVHYGMNYQFLGVDKTTTLMGRTVQMDEINNPSRIIYIADGGLFRTGSTASSENVLDANTEDGSSVKDGGISFPLDDGKVPSDKPTMSPRHRGCSVCVFLDGHVEKLDTMKVMLVRRDSPECLYAVPVVPKK